MMSIYLSHYFRHYHPSRDSLTEEAYLRDNLPILRSEVYRCLLLNNYFWAIWSMRILKEEKLGDPTLFNFDFAEARVQMQKHVQEKCPIS
jgi:hypothetical protein